MIRNRIKEIHKRKYKHMNQTEFAHLLGISQAYLSEIENNVHQPSIKKFQEFAKKLNMKDWRSLIVDEYESNAV
ncbi:MAG: helix-turn-helix domain-containing protein [Caulobacteraceae bacterium]